MGWEGREGDERFGLGRDGGLRSRLMIASMIDLTKIQSSHFPLIMYSASKGLIFQSRFVGMVEDV